MTVNDIAKILNAEAFACSELMESTEIHSACGSDMMSDVLAYVKDQGLLLTGLVNPQVVRTAEMMDIACVVFVRGKRPDQMVIDAATSKNIILLGTTERMYQACGKLYSAGLDVGE